MPFQIVRDDITKMRVDAIVNAANQSLLGVGGVDGAIHAAAGSGLLAECRKLGGCKTGEAKITGAYDLPCKYVIHTVGPVWHGGTQGEPALLQSCFERSLALAAEYGCESVAFPLIAAGTYGYPRDAVMETALRVFRAFLEDHDMTITLVIFDRESFLKASDRFGEIRSYIAQHYVDVQEQRFCRRRNNAPGDAASASLFASAVPMPPQASFAPSMAHGKLPRTLEEAVGRAEDGFSQKLLALIDARGMTDAQTYKKANIDRKLFSKIRSDPQYRPKKQTVLAFAIALELSLPETEELLGSAGFSLSRSLKFDLIVRYFIEKGDYNIFAINEALFAFDQTLIGG